MIKYLIIFPELLQSFLLSHRLLDALMQQDPPEDKNLNGLYRAKQMTSTNIFLFRSHITSI